MAGTAVLSAHLVDIWDRLGRNRIMELTPGDYRRASGGASHTKLAQVIAGGDATKSAALMAEHLSMVLEVLGIGKSAET